MKKVILLSVGLVFFLSLALGYQLWSSFLNSPASDKKEEVIFEVAPGQTLRQVAQDLEKRGVIRRSMAFLIMARLNGQSNRLKVGEYLLNKNMRPNDVLETITSGHSVGRNFTVAEGLNIFEIAEIFEAGGFGSKKEFWKLITDQQFIQQVLGEKQPTLEGYLYPETYQVTRYTEARTVVRTMVARFLDVYNREIEPLAKASGMNRHQIVTLASIIEKETGAPEERPMISSVFHNRLKKSMMLQTDPTVLYGKARKSGKMEMSITRADLTTPTEYNTYTIKGLPPGPIASPGRAALLAAVQPATSEFLFFVSQNNGTHVFSKDLDGHNKAVQQYQLNAKARQGKSWRDLQKERGGNLQEQGAQFAEPAKLEPAPRGAVEPFPGQTKGPKKQPEPDSKIKR